MELKERLSTLPLQTDGMPEHVCLDCIEYTVCSQVNLHHTACLGTSKARLSLACNAASVLGA